jgi:hypothetical protein
LSSRICWRDEARARVVTLADAFAAPPHALLENDGRGCALVPTFDMKDRSMLILPRGNACRQDQEERMARWEFSAIASGGMPKFSPAD